MEAVPQTVVKSRMIVNETVLYQPHRGQAVEVASHRDGSFVRIILGDEQPYKRTVTVGTDWQPLDFGWCGSNPSQVVLCNEEGVFHSRIPTVEERARVLGLVVELGLAGDDGPCLEVPPLESCRFRPSPSRTYLVRCPTGRAKLTVCAVPGDAE